MSVQIPDLPHGGDRESFFILQENAKNANNNLQNTHFCVFYDKNQGGFSLDIAKRGSEKSPESDREMGGLSSNEKGKRGKRMLSRRGRKAREGGGGRRPAGNARFYL